MVLVHQPAREIGIVATMENMDQFCTDGETVLSDGQLKIQHLSTTYLLSKSYIIHKHGALSIIK
jgi:hypothetical protein